MYALLIVVCPFVLFLLAIVLTVLLRYTDFDYPFGIFKLFLKKILHRKLKSNTNTSKIHVWISLNIFYLLNITNWDRTQVFPTYEGFSRGWIQMLWKFKHFLLYQCCVTFVKNPLKGHEWRDCDYGTCPWSSVAHMILRQSSA
jgi:hypothetical protein